MNRDETIAIFDRVVARCDGIERKGKTMPYTSDNGHMFSQVNKEGELGIRLPPADGKAFMDTHGAGPFLSYGAKMRDYVCIPEAMLGDEDALVDLLRKGHAHVMIDAMPDGQHFDETGAPAPAATATPTGFPPPHPIRPLAAWKAFQGLVRNREDTRYVFAFFDAVNGRSYEQFYIRFAESEYGRRVVADPKHIGRLLMDRDTLESYGPDTFAAAYLHYLDSENLQPEGVYEANWDNAPERMQSLRDDWPHLYAMLYMMNLSHDLYHVLTGYGRDPLGEALLLLCSGVQTGGRGPKWLGRMAGLRIRQEIPSWPVGRMMAEAKRLADTAAHFPTTDLPALLPLPLDEARARLNIGRPALYLDTIARWDGEMP
ncbi:Uncharacterized protein SCF082_LOCUS28924, partial [Durusdinium trenchii]